jgi:hypothetical protein
LMPDHLHLLVEGPADELRQKLAHVAARTSQHLGHKRLWYRIPDPERVGSDDKLLRTVGYILLNPCRARYVADPLEWRWSTLRDLVGASHPAWVDARRLGTVLGWAPDVTTRRLLRMLAQDRTVRSPELRDGEAIGDGVISPQAIVAGAVSAFCVTRTELAVRGKPRSALAEAAARSSARARSVAADLGLNRLPRRVSIPVDELAVAAILRCASDPRLRIAQVPAEWIHGRWERTGTAALVPG